jgi:NADH-quinone oxidoreductase subunit L
MASLELTLAIPLLPFVSFVVALLVGQFRRDLLPAGGASVGIAATGAALALSAWTALGVGRGETYNTTVYEWVSGTPFDLHFGVLVDPLSALMLVVVSLITFLVHVFSLGYMNDEDEPGLPRYYAGLGLFSASMLAFVVADNLLMAFMFFELVGLCSWLLIGHWFREPGPPSAAKKAFLVTRFGDYFFLVGVVGVFATFGTSRFLGTEASPGFPDLAHAALDGDAGAVTTYLGLGPEAWFAVLGLLVLGGVVGKSAQFPLHTWLPDAMEGPTPVSALIHAATMVAAGVYLVARMYGFYALLPTVLALIALVGAVTALFSASMALVKREIKQVLAYSTISQYGYIMLGLGAGGYVAASFHLLTHAIFKALLFLGAGAVIVAMHHTEDMWQMGGLKEKLPVTYYAFLSGSLALAGIIPFAGFWSKDEVLFKALKYGLGTGGVEGTLLLVAYALGLVAVLFTGFYTFRMVMLTFHGDARTGAAEEPHGVGWNMKFPLTALGVLAATAGFLNPAPVEELTGAHLTFLHDWLDGPAAVEHLSAHHYEELLLATEAGAGRTAAEIGPLAPAAVSLALALVGTGTAILLYRGSSPERHTETLGPVRTVLFNNYYQDEYQDWIATGVALPLARAADAFDNSVVDGVVNGVSSVSLFTGDRVKRIQTGLVTQYAALIVLGLVALLVGFGLVGGWLL